MNERSEEIEIQNWNDKINFVFIHKISMFFDLFMSLLSVFLLVPVLSCAIQYAYWGKFYNRPIGKWRCDDINHNITSDKKKEMLAVRNKTSSHKWKFLRYFICAFSSFYIRTKQKVLAATWKQFRVAVVFFSFISLWIVSNLSSINPSVYCLASETTTWRHKIYSKHHFLWYRAYKYD